MIRIDPYTLLLHDQLASFLRQNKKSCVSFIEYVESFLTAKKPETENCFLIRGGTGIVLGALFFSRNGILFHCLPGAVAERFCEHAAPLLSALLADHFIACITGELIGTQFLDELCKKNKKLESRIYHLMEYVSPHTDEAGQPSVLPIVACVPDDETALFPLRKAYELAEVLPEGIAFSDSACRAILRRILGEKHVIAIRDQDSDEFVAMAAINGYTQEIIQIGGLYTVPEYRSHGYAASLVRHFGQTALAEKKSCVLFVRTDNFPAIRAYEKGGFVKNGHYGISYYKND